MRELAARLEEVHQRVEQAAQRSGRRAENITLVAVTKTQPLETLIAAYQAGLRHFGENRVVEGRAKAISLAAWLEPQSGRAPTWHLIGHVQSRQVAEVLGEYGLMHSLDSLKLAQRIDRLAKREGRPPLPVLLQCNVSGEQSKSGFELSRWQTDKAQFKVFLEAVIQMGCLNSLLICGLMTIAPWFNNPTQARPTFKSLAALQETLQQELPQVGWTHLSMGMSDDFEVAIEEGATMVRVGRAIFGERA